MKRWYATQLYWFGSFFKKILSHMFCFVSEFSFLQKSLNESLSSSWLKWDSRNFQSTFIATLGQDKKTSQQFCMSRDVTAFLHFPDLYFYFTLGNKY